MLSLKFGVICLALALFFKKANAALGTACTTSGDCDAGNNEVCDTVVTNECACDDGGGYAPGPTTTTTCYQAVNLGDACTPGQNDACQLGDGGTGAICSGTSTCVCDTGNSYEESGGTCKKDCGTPVNPTGYTLTASSGTLEGDAASVACATGYNEDAGTPTDVTCQASGDWAVPSGCSAVVCSALSDPSNGAVDTSAGTSYNDQATYSCNSGYSLSGNAQVVCQADGTWEALPTCVRDCGTPVNPTGYTLTASSGTQEGNAASVACATGYNEDAGTPADVTCQASGDWTVPSGCSAVVCSALSDPSNGAVDTSAGTSYNDQAIYSCNSGYSLSGNAQVLCQADGTWEALPTCVRDCGTPVNPTGYTLTASSGTQEGDAASVACATGYNEDAGTPADVTCQASGDWTVPSGCSAVDCGPLTQPANGTITYSSGTIYNSVATFSCESGFYVDGTATRTCGSGGSWSGSSPTCAINGAGGMGQMFSFIVLIGTLVLAVM